MKKIIFLCTTLLSIAVIYGYSQSGQNEIAEKHSKQANPKDLNWINNSDARESMADIEYFTQKKAPEHRPGILLILTADRSKSGGSSSFLKNYIYGTTNQAGC